MPNINNQPFLNYSGYLKQKYGTKAYRVSVDAGFSCPNRGSRSNAGCTFCDEHGARAPYLGNKRELKNQIDGGMAFMQKRYGAKIFLLYFQAFSSTHASVAKLKQLYSYALGLGNFRELIVSTRPDCIDKEKADLLASYRTAQREVWVELGLQSIHNRTLKRIRRGHGTDDFFSAYKLLRERGIHIAPHVMFGFPGETERDIMKTITELAKLRPDGIKIHNLNIPRDTHMHFEYMLGELTVPSMNRHIDYVCSALELLPNDTVIMRLTCDTPSENRIAPKNIIEKSRFYSMVRDRMLKSGRKQGRLFIGQC